MGIGLDTWDISLDDFSLSMEVGEILMQTTRHAPSPEAVTRTNILCVWKLLYVTEQLYMAISSLSNVAILLSYLRIFPNPRFRTACWIVIGWTATNILFALLLIFQCHPINAAWEVWEGESTVPHTCLKVQALSQAGSIVGILQDVVILVLPFPVLAGLHMKWRYKLRVMVMFSLGLFVVVTSCVRLWCMILFARSTNPEWDYFDTFILSFVNAAVLVLVANLPALWILFLRVRARMVAVWRKKMGSEVLEDRPSLDANVGAVPDTIGKVKRQPARSPASRLLSEMSEMGVTAEENHGHEHRGGDDNAIELRERV